MAHLNEVKLIGHVGRDPELRKMPNGDSVVNFSLATTKKFKGKNGEKEERTEWHNLVAFEGLADVIGQYVSKGHLLYVCGGLKTRTWTDKDGIERNTTEIVLDDMQMLNSPKPAQNQEAE